MNIAIVLFVIMDSSTILTNGLYNAALFKPAYQSTTMMPALAYFAVDGNNDDNETHRYCQNTELETTPWLIVDMRGQFVVDAIRLTNRGDLDPNILRLRNFQIDIFQQDPRNLANFPNITDDVCYNQSDPLGIRTYTFNCPARPSSPEYLNICELEVLTNKANFEEYLFTIKLDNKLSDSVMDTITVNDPNTCVQECLDRRSHRCTSFNWVTTSKACHLFSVNPSKDLTSYLTSEPGTHFYVQVNSF